MNRAVFAGLLIVALTGLGPQISAADELAEQIARETAAEELTERLKGTFGPGRAEMSAPVETRDGITMCATTNATNANGTYIGKTYWRITMSKDGAEIIKAEDVTGLLSNCYSERYRRFDELLDR